MATSDHYGLTSDLWRRSSPFLATLLFQSFIGPGEGILSQISTTPYFIETQSEFEGRYGKPVLLTDCEIALLLDSLQLSSPITPDGISAREALWTKLLALWNKEAPYAQ